jgi:hypothetical protein
MNTIYKLEIFAAIVGIFIVAMFLLPTPLTFTGYVSGLNMTIYSQDLDLYVDGSQSYTLTSEANLNLRSFMLDGEVIGDGRAEIFLDNGKGQQFLVYENIEKNPEFKGPHLLTGVPSITGKSITGIEGIEEKKGMWLVIQKKSPINYEFTPLKESDSIVPGEFYASCAETCNMPQNLFNSNAYQLIFRLEKGTAVKLNAIKYILQE